MGNAMDRATATELVSIRLTEMAGAAFALILSTLVLTVHGGTVWDLLQSSTEWTLLAGHWWRTTSMSATLALSCCEALATMTWASAIASISSMASAVSM